VCADDDEGRLVNMSRGYKASAQKSAERSLKAEQGEIASEEKAIKSPSEIEARIKSLEEEKRQLKVHLVQVKAVKKEERIRVRGEREEKLAGIRVKLDAVLEVIYDYNKLGKAAKLQSGILDRIAKLVLK